MKTVISKISPYLIENAQANQPYQTLFNPNQVAKVVAVH